MKVMCDTGEKCFVVMFCESSVKNLVLPAKLFFTWFDIEAIKKQAIPTCLYLEVSLYLELKLQQEGHHAGSGPGLAPTEMRC